MKKIGYVKQKLAVTLGIGIYAAILYALPFSCIFKEIFGFKCPGCGITRALLAVLRGNLKAAFEFHWMVFSLPILYLCFLYDGRPFKNKFMNILLYTVIISGFMINWIFNTNI